MVNRKILLFKLYMLTFKTYLFQRFQSENMGGSQSAILKVLNKRMTPCFKPITIYRCYKDCNWSKSSN